MGELRDVPSAAQRFQQEHAGRHAPREHVDGSKLVLQQLGLRGDDLKVIRGAGFVLLGGDVQRALCVARRLVVVLRFLLQDAQCGERIFNCWKAAKAVCR